MPEDSRVSKFETPDGVTRFTSSRRRFSCAIAAASKGSTGPQPTGWVSAAPVDRRLARADLQPRCPSPRARVHHRLRALTLRFSFAHEPSLGLAPKLVAQIFESIVEIAKTSISILLVEHNTRLALETAHRAHVQVTGEVAGSAAGRLRRASLGRSGAGVAPLVAAFASCQESEFFPCDIGLRTLSRQSKRWPSCACPIGPPRVCFASLVGAGCSIGVVGNIL